MTHRQEFGHGLVSAFVGAIRLLDQPGRRGIVLLLGLIFLSSILETLSIGLIFPLFSWIEDPARAISDERLQWLMSMVGVADSRVFVLLMLCGYGILFSLKSAFLLFSQYWQIKFLQQNQSRVSRNLLLGYLRLPYVTHLNRTSGELIRNLTESVPGMFSGTLNNGLRAMSESLTLICIVIVLVIADPLAALVAVVVTGFGVGTCVAATRYPLSRWGKNKLERQRERLETLQQTLRGVKEIKVLQAESFFAHAFYKAQTGFAQTVVRLTVYADIPRFVIESLMVWVVVAVVAISYPWVNPGKSLIATLALFAAAAFRLAPSANRIVTALSAAYQNFAAVDWIARDFALIAQNTASDRGGDGETPVAFQELRLEKISFQYPNAKTSAIDDVSFSLRKGEVIGLSGASGAGKSTVADILLGLFQPDRGSIYLNGNDISIHPRSWQRLVGYVPQSIAMFNESVRYNIALGRERNEVDDKALMNAIELSQVSEYLGTLERGLDTPLTEHGLRLSGGQRQRIGIARALYSDPPVLILDEATAALDKHVENEIVHAINAVRTHKAVVVIAHSPELMRICDRIVLLDGGRVRAVGTFDDLMARDPHFVRLMTTTGANAADEKMPVADQAAAGRR